MLRKIFLKWLFFFISSAFILTVYASYYFQTHSAEKAALELIALKISDVRKQIQVAENNVEQIKKMTDTTALVRARSFARFVENNPNLLQDKKQIDEIKRILDVDELHVSDEKGILVLAVPESYLGYDMNSSEQSKPFMKALTDKTFELVQEPRKNGYGQIVQYAGVARRDRPGIVQIGFQPHRLLEAMKLADISLLSSSLRIVKSGRIIIDRVESEPGLPNLSKAEPQTEQQRELRIFSEQAAKVLAKKNTPEVQQFFCNGHICGTIKKDGYIITGIVPKSEMYLNRNAIVVILVFVNLLLFTIVFTLVSLLVQNLVIDGIEKVNNSLSKITNGDLNESVDVRNSKEFEDLSQGINNTVNALKIAIAEAASRLNKELEFARIIQTSALPNKCPPFPDTPEFDLFAQMDTAKEVGGDFYDYFMLDNRHLVFLIADVSGKGIPAAMFMMQAKMLLKQLAEDGLEVHQILTAANKGLCSGNDAGMFVTIFMAILDTETGKMTCVNGGHNPPLLKRADGSFEYLHIKINFILAGIDDFQYDSEEIQLMPNDCLLLYTDGVTEALNSKQELFGESRLLEILNRDNSDEKSPAELVTAVRDAIRSYAEGTPQSDDITIMSVRYFGPASIKELTVTAELNQLAKVLAFIETNLMKFDLTKKHVNSLLLATEEIFVNIVHYAYQPNSGTATIIFSYQKNEIEIIIKDSGRPFNPLSKEPPNIYQKLQDRRIGGLGIYLARKLTDFIDYRRENNENILCMRKKLN